MKDEKLILSGDTTLEYEIACIDVTPLNEEDVKSEIVCIGLWTDITVRIFKLPSLEEIAKEPLGGGKFKLCLAFSMTCNFLGFIMSISLLVLAIFI